MYSTRVYIAGDDHYLYDGLQKALKRKGYSTTVVDSGYPIAEMMDGWPDIFVIDIELPGINGIEICKWLKDHEPSAHIPVILVAAEPYLKILAASARPDDFLEKPFTSQQAIKKIQQALLTEKFD